MLGRAGRRQRRNGPQGKLIHNSAARVESQHAPSMEECAQRSVQWVPRGYSNALSEIRVRYDGMWMLELYTRVKRCNLFGFSRSFPSTCLRTASDTVRTLLHNLPTTL